jgi:hypothetical protein
MLPIPCRIRTELVGSGFDLWHIAAQLKPSSAPARLDLVIPPVMGLEGIEKEQRTVRDAGSNNDSRCQRLRDDEARRSGAQA